MIETKGLITTADLKLMFQNCTAGQQMKMLTHTHIHMHTNAHAIASKNIFLDPTHRNEDLVPTLKRFLKFLRPTRYAFSYREKRTLKTA